MLEYFTRREELLLARHCSAVYQGAPEMVTALGVPSCKGYLYLTPDALHFGDNVWLRAKKGVPLIAMLYDTDGLLWIVDREFNECWLTLARRDQITYEPSGFRPHHYTVPTEHPSVRRFEPTPREPSIQNKGSK